MKTSEDLFQLIKSLSRSEKGYFKKFAALHTREENTYMKLFDAIEKQEEYDEEKAIEELNLDKPLKNFSVLKAYLYSFILKSLRLYHSHRSVGLYLKEQLEYVEILFEKRLHKQSERFIEKTLEVAKKYDQFPYILDLLNWQTEIMSSRSYKGDTENDAEELYNNIKDSANKSGNIAAYRYFMALITIKKSTSLFIREENESRSRTELKDHSLLKSEKQALSVHALEYYYQWYSFYHFNKGDIKGEYKYNLALTSLMEKYPHQIKENPSVYIAALNNMAMAQLVLKKYNESLPTIKKMHAVNSNWERSQMWIYYTASYAESQFCIITGEFTRGVKLVQEIEKEMLTNPVQGKYRQLEMNLYLAMFHIYFGTGNYSKANINLNKIINYELIDLRVDLHVFARLLSLVVHYEMGNKELLSYTVKSAHRFLSKRKRLYKFENILLDFVRKKLINMSSRKEQIAAFKELRVNLEPIITDEYESQAFNYFDFVSWVDSKIEGRSFEEIVKRKIKEI